jgi:hypothetical protein
MIHNLVVSLAVLAIVIGCSTRVPSRLTFAPNPPACDSLVRRADSIFTARPARDEDDRPGPLGLDSSYVPPQPRTIALAPFPVPGDVTGDKVVFLALVDTAGFLVPGSDVVIGMESDPQYAERSRRAWRGIGQLEPATWFGCRVTGKLKVTFAF